MRKPRLLDLFCGAGGCATGYHRAGFDVFGVDLAPQPRYPFDSAKAGALEFLSCLAEADAMNPDALNATGGLSLSDFDVIHASPPCQKYSAMARAVKTKAPDLVPAVRAALRSAGKPYVIENVEGAPLEGPLMLCGTMFHLKVRRHRLFEIHPNILILTPPCSCLNGVVTGRLIGHRCGGKVAPGRTKPPAATESQRRDAIGVPWMSGKEARQAIPPAYTEFIGRQLIRALEVES
jgi:DNA (cytosine-5)-methyltransferase 1